jgi:subtilisin family serine protease
LLRWCYETARIFPVRLFSTHRSDATMKHKLTLKFGTLALILIIGMTLWGSREMRVSAEDMHQDIPWVDPALLAKSKTDEPLDYLIFFEERADLSQAFSMSWEARGWYVYETLTAFAEESQAEVRKYLDDEGVPYEAFWVQNVIAVQSSTGATLTGLLSYAEIESLQSIPQIFVIDPFSISSDPDEVEVAGTASNLTQIKADQVWSMGFDGEGLILGSIDTGVRYTHEALVASYRGNLGDDLFSHHYQWWDAVNHQSEPYDDHGHGSHVTGIMVGASSPGAEIGVAPGADWIACKAIKQNGGGLGSDLIKCGQFMTAPTNLNGANPNPNVRPHVVNNSWGDCGRTYSGWYEGVIDTWLAAGIYPIFANGNSSGCGYSMPPGLNTVSNPARSGHVTAVGSTGRDDGEYAVHSNWGPTDNSDTLNPNGYPAIKPQVVAPGEGIRSAVASGDDAYVAWSGTSMSAPHVAGLVALVWDAGDCLVGDYVATETLIQDTATPIAYDTGNGDEGPDNVPNHATGWGEVDALAAVEQAIEYCESGYLDGQVVDAVDGQPISGARVEAVSLGDQVTSTSILTDEGGYYRLFVNSQEMYEITASAYGYLTEIMSAVILQGPGTTTTTHFNLNPKTNLVSLSGVVSDGSGHGYPLYARIMLESGGHSITVFTNPFDGTYQVMTYDDLVYDLRVESVIPGYQKVLDTALTFPQPSVTRDIALLVDEACNAPGYGLINSLAQSFDGLGTPQGWEVWDHAGTGVTWAFDDTPDRGNLTGGSGGFAMVDSDYAGPVDVDTSLVSPPIDLSGETVVMLTFEQDFFSYAENNAEVADVDISIDGGEWLNVLRQTGSVRGPNQQSIDISEMAANQENVRVRFRYYNANSEWWWQVDSVRVGGQVCVPVTGGVLTGQVSNKHSGELLVGAIVSSDFGSVETIATPEDPILGGGFYWSFQPLTGNPQTITVTGAKSLYLSSSAEVEMHLSQVIRHDIQLVSYLNHLGFFFNNLTALIWELLLNLIGLVMKV